jgi:hypothetical protein
MVVVVVVEVEVDIDVERDDRIVDRKVDVDGLGSMRTSARVECAPPDESYLETATAPPTPSTATSAIPARSRVRCTAKYYRRPSD